MDLSGVYFLDEVGGEGGGAELFFLRAWVEVMEAVPLMLGMIQFGLLIT